MSESNYKLDQNLPYSSATVKKLVETLKANSIKIPNKSQKPALYKLFYYLCQTKNYSIIPKAKNHMSIVEYIKLHTSKSKRTKRQQEKTKPPTKRLQIDNNLNKINTDMDTSDEFDTMPETDIEDTTTLPPQPIRCSTPNEIIIIEDDIYNNNLNQQNQEPTSIDNQIFENNSKFENVSLNDDIYK